MEGTLENSQMTATEKDRAGWLAALSVLRETEMMIAMKTAAGRGPGKTTPREEERLAGAWHFIYLGKSSHVIFLLSVSVWIVRN